jgi:hypothetical protein
MRGKRQVAGIDGSFRGMKWGGADQRLHRVGYLPSLSAGHNVRHWLVPRTGSCPANTNNLSISSFSIRDNFTTMAPIDEALAEIELQDPADGFTLKNFAEKHGVDCSTLEQGCKGKTGPRSDGYASQQLLNPQQEQALVQYIEDLTAWGLSPTRAMVCNFVSNILKQHVGVNWILRFIRRNHDHLISKWSAGIDVVRHRANSKRKYELYFDLLHHKIVQYNVWPCNTYNMNEKGFMIGVTGRSKQVFSRAQWESKQVRAALQDGSREWVTVVATICADGSTLPPALIYSLANCTLQAS